MEYSLFPRVPVSLERSSLNESWGFRLQGGTDFRIPLSIKKVCSLFSNDSNDGFRMFV